MRRLGFVSLTAFLLAVAGVPTGCEWSGGSSNSFNTSRGAGININISGVYEGLLGGGKAVETSRGNIRSLTLTQAGNRVEVVDNQGSRYRGTVGVPDVRTTATKGGTIPPRTEIMQFQVNWQGTDGVAAKEVQFVGVIDVVTIEQVQSTEQTTSRTVARTTNNSSGGSSSSTRRTNNTITTEPDDNGNGGGGGSNTNIIEDIGDGTNIIGFLNAFVGATTTNAETEVDRESESNQSNEEAVDTDDTVETTTTRTFSLTAANSQFRLRGTWVEAGGRSGSVSALSPGSGLISNTDTTITTGRGGAETVN